MQILSRLQIGDQLGFRHVEKVEPELGIRFEPADEKEESPPSRLQRLKIGMVQNRPHLPAGGFVRNGKQLGLVGRLARRHVRLDNLAEERLPIAATGQARSLRRLNRHLTEYLFEQVFGRHSRWRRDG